MDLTNCPACGRQVSNQATNCPNCGYALNNYNNNYNNNNYNNYNNNYNQPQNVNTNSDKSLKGGAAGFALTFFLGIIGLVLCICLGDDACKKAAITTFIVCIVLIFAMYALMIGVAGLAACAE